MKKRLFGLVLAVCLSFGFMSCGGNKEKDTYKLGFSGPLTGGAASYGLGVKNAVEMALEEINAAGGINGHKVEFKAMDDELEAGKAKTNYTYLYDEFGMQFSLGCVTSGACIEYGKLAKADKVFCLTPSATSDGVAETGVYQMCFSDSGQGVAAANYVSTLTGVKVGIFYDASDAYSKGIYDNFKANYHGTTVEASFTADTKTDFTAQVQTLKDCDFIFLPIYYSEAALFIKTAKGIVADDAVYYGCDGLDGIDTSVANFNVNDYPQEISYLSHFSTASTDQATVDFVRKYTEKYGTETLNQFGASAYDCVYALKAAIERAVASGKDVPTDISASALYDILVYEFTHGFTYSGVTGKNITWNTDCTVSKGALKFVVNPNRNQD